jgi:hypothetical protein
VIYVRNADRRQVQILGVSPSSGDSTAHSPPDPEPPKIATKALWDTGASGGGSAPRAFAADGR